MVTGDSLEALRKTGHENSSSHLSHVEIWNTCASWACETDFVISLVILCSVTFYLVSFVLTWATRPYTLLVLVLIVVICLRH